MTFWCRYNDDRHQDLLQQKGMRGKKKTKHSKPDKNLSTSESSPFREHGEHFNVKPFYSATISKNEMWVKASPRWKGSTVQLSMHIHIYHSNTVIKIDRNNL